jgi:small-conductance mechanosensitive channel
MYVSISQNLHIYFLRALFAFSRFIGDEKNESFVVDHLSITYTKFRKSDGQEVYFPNQVLLTKVLCNTRRAGDMSETVQIDLPYDISYPKYMEFRSAIGEYVRGEPNDWTGKFELMPQELIEMGHKLRLNISVQARGNWMDGSKRYDSSTCHCTAFTSIQIPNYIYKFKPLCTYEIQLGFNIFQLGQEG